MVRKILYISILILLCFNACKPDEDIIEPPTVIKETPAISDTTRTDTTRTDTVTNSQLDLATRYITEPSLNLNDSLDIGNLIVNNDWIKTLGADNSNKRFILLEEFTGHKCSSCPRGSREVARLKGIFGNQLIPVSIHTSFFANPNSPGSSMYTTDFRVTGGHGAAYSQAFKVSGNPRAIVSRIGISQAETQWETDIMALRDLVPDAKLSLTNYYDSINHVVRSQVDIDWNITSSNDFHLQLFVIESGIFDWQLDGSNDIQNYEHKFVLRKVVNNTFGTDLDSANGGSSEKFQYIFNLDSNWKTGNIEVVAFVFNNDPNAYEVIQANSAFIK